MSSVVSILCGCCVEDIAYSTAGAGCSDFRLCCHFTRSFSTELPKVLQLPNPKSMIPPGGGALNGNDFRLLWGFIASLWASEMQLRGQ